MEKRKALNFDLDTNVMKELGVYPSGYQALGKSFEEQGFTHRQGSGYISKNRLTESDVQNALKKIIDKNPWICECVKKIDVTDIGRQHDLTAIVKRFGAMLSAQQDSRAESTEKKLTASDEAVIKRIRSSIQGSEFDKLYSGTDKSVGADKKLAAIIKFFANGDEEQSGRIFKSSALYKIENGDGYVKGLFADITQSKRSFMNTSLNRNVGRSKNDGRAR